MEKYGSILLKTSIGKMDEEMLTLQPNGSTRPGGRNWSHISLASVSGARPAFSSPPK